MQNNTFLPDQWLLVGVDAPDRWTPLAAHSLLLRLRIDAGQVHTCEHAAHTLAGKLEMLLAHKTGLIRVFANGFEGLQEVLNQAAETCEGGAERMLLYHYDLKPVALLATLSLPENSTWSGWYTGDVNEPVCPSKVDRSAWLGSNAISADTYDERWTAAFAVWAQAASNGLDEEDALDWYGTTDPEEQAELEVTPAQNNVVHLRMTSSTSQVPPRPAGNDDTYRLAASAGERNRCIEREEPCRYTLSCAYPTEPKLNVELTWYASKHAPILVEFHPKIAMPLLLPVVGIPGPIGAEGCNGWRLEVPLKTIGDARELWKDLNAVGHVFIHTAPV